MALLLTGLAVAVVPTQQANAAEDAGDFTAWQWNIAGGIHGTHLQQVKIAAGSIIKYDSDFAVVNELCKDQYYDLIDRLREYGWPQGTSFARFTKMDDRGSCAADGAGSGPMGFGIFSKHQLAPGIEQIELPEDTDDGRDDRVHSLACATLKVNTDVKLCGTHITFTPSPNTIRDEQIQVVTDHVNSYVNSGDVVVLAGDLNMQPHEEGLNGLYSPNVGGTVNQYNVGRFRELDDNDASHCLGYGDFTKDNGDPPPACGAGGRKIDHIFVSENRLGSYSAQVLGISESCGGPCSDHHAIVGHFERDFTQETPDGFTRDIYYNGEVVATVAWNDYANDDHTRDLDDFKICDERADSLAPYFVVEYEGDRREERIDGGNGNCEIQGIGNVSPKGDRVSFKVYLSDAGSTEPDHTNNLTYYFIE